MYEGFQVFWGIAVFGFSGCWSNRQTDGLRISPLRHVALARTSPHPCPCTNSSTMAGRRKTPLHFVRAGLLLLVCGENTPTSLRFCVQHVLRAAQASHLLPGPACQPPAVYWAQAAHPGTLIGKALIIHRKFLQWRASPRLSSRPECLCLDCMHAAQRLHACPCRVLQPAAVRRSGSGRQSVMADTSGSRLRVS